MPSKTLGFSLSDAMCALHGPLVVTIDARSTTILTLELASERSAETWRAHCEALEAPHVFSLGLASDRGRGLGAGSQAACDRALGEAEDCHAGRDLCELLQPLERNASATLGQEDDAAPQFARAKSASHLHKRLPQSDTAHDACEPARTLYDQRARRRHWLREA